MKKINIVCGYNGLGKSKFIKKNTQEKTVHWFDNERFLNVQQKTLQDFANFKFSKNNNEIYKIIFQRDFNVDLENIDNQNNSIKSLFLIFNCLDYIKAGEVLVIENIETFLHENAINKAVLFLINVAIKKDFLIFFETHNDCVLNAVRIAVAKKLLNHTEVKIYFFEKINNCNDININEKGKIKEWDDGFFNQFEKDLCVLQEIEIDKEGGIDICKDGFFTQSDKDYRNLYEF